MIKGCIFDLDGVICDTAHFHYLAWKELANSVGIDFDHAFNEKLKGVSRIKSLELILDHGSKTLSKSEFDSKLAEKNEQFLGFVNTMNPGDELPGVVSFLKELKAAGIKIALGSASKNAPLILSRLQLTDFFEVLIDGNKVTKAKPDPEVFLKGAEGLKLEPNECVVFEDAVSGIQAAKSGGFKAIGIGDPDTLSQADHIYSGFETITLNTIKELYP